MANEYVPASAMCVVAHPDDTEFLFAGTVAKWTQAGADVTYVIVTKGDKGSADPEMTPSRLTEIREAEQRAAARILGVRACLFLGYEDGYLEPTLGLRRDITRLLRRYRPEVLMTFDPETRFFGGVYPNHPDHRAAGDAAIDAMFPSARDRLTFPELLADGLEPHNVKQLWLGSSAQSNFWVDITPTIELKMEAMRAHPSQFGEDMVQFGAEMARMQAASQPFDYAETYRRIVMDEGLAELAQGI
ncbi:MAG: PIG-L family deacetylase [Dehalococcoidia bacterium]|nr:PIG-L family deacetylase [Dehalococcoidia bacterium]